jgi:DNA-damage-inducible protein D
MDNTTISIDIFEKTRQEANNFEFWSARKIASLLEYSKWDNFLDVIKKARDSIRQNSESISDHIKKSKTFVEVGNNAVRQVDDYRLSRYACYLIAMNGDPKKPQIALAQKYFAIQTRLQELREIEDRDLERIGARKRYAQSDKYLSSTVLNHGTTGEELSIIKSNGDRMFFGGNSTSDMRKKYQIKETEPIADYAPTPILTAKKLANDLTAYKVARRRISGFDKINDEHSTNNEAVRNTLIDRGVYPESLPPEENIKAIEQRIKAQDDKKLT